MPIAYTLIFTPLVVMHLLTVRTDHDKDRSFQRVAAIPAAHQLRDLHRPEYQGVIALRELERPRVRHHGLYPELPGSGSRCQRA